MDVFDQATELERLDREAALSRARAAMDQGGPDWIDGVACCRECGSRPFVALLLAIWLYCLYLWAS